MQNIRIRHTIILDDPTPDPRGLEGHIPDASPAPQVRQGGLVGHIKQPNQHPGCLTLQCTLVTCVSSACPQLPEHATVSAALLRSLRTMGDWRTTGCRMRRPGTQRKSKRPTGERPSWLKTGSATGYHVFRTDSAAALVQEWHTYDRAPACWTLVGHSLLLAHMQPHSLLPLFADCREKEAHNRAVVLEMIGDLPEAEAKPPPNMLFICKLNPVGAGANR